MSRTLLTEEAWHRLLIAFREQPANLAHASRTTGVSRDIARRAWQQGYAELAFARTPIRTVLAKEHEELHRKQLEAKLQTVDEETQAQQEEAAARVEARKDEFQGVKIARKNTLALIGITGVALKAGHRAAQLLEQRAQHLDPEKASDAAEARAILREVGAFAQRSQQTFRGVLEMQRILTGQPLAVIGVQPTQLSAEEITAGLASVARAFSHAEAEGMIGQVFPGEVVDLPDEAAEATDDTLV